MKFTIRQFTKKGLQVVGKVNGTWEDLADKCVEVYNTCDEQYPLATLIEAYIENCLSDHGEETTWEEYIDSVSDDVMHTNAPFIYNGRNQQITSFHDKVYRRIEALAVQQCKAYFDKEEYVHPEVKTKAKRTSSSSEKTKAKYPGVYPAPLKSNPNRYVAYYRKDNQTILIGRFEDFETAVREKIKVTKVGNADLILKSLKK